MVNGTVYAYTSINSLTCTFNGVTPNPTGAGIVANDAVLQTLVTSGDSFFDWINAINVTPTFGTTYQGRYVISGVGTSKIGMSVAGDAIDMTTAYLGARILVNLGDGHGAITGLVPFKENLVFFKKDAIIPIQVKYGKEYNTAIGSGGISYDNTTLDTIIKPLVSRNNVGALHQGVIIPAEDEVYYISADNEFKKLSAEMDGTTTPSSLVLSQDIYNMLRECDFTQSRGIYYNRSVFISCAFKNSTVNDTVLQYDIDNKTFYFHAIPANSFYIKDQELYFTSSLEVGIFRWFQKYEIDNVAEDNDGSVEYVWRSGRHVFGDVFRKKKSAIFAVYMRMTPNTEVSVKIDYGDLGYLYQDEFKIKGDGSSSVGGTDIISAPLNSSYGTSAYGYFPYGTPSSGYAGLDTPENPTPYVDVVAFKTIKLRYQPYDFTVEFRSNDIAQKCKILSYGFCIEEKGEIPKRSIINT